MRPHNWFAAPLTVILFLAGFCGFHAQGSEPVYPPWWYEQGVVSSSTLNDYAVANVGQAKNFTLAAINELDTDLAQFGGAGTSLDTYASRLISTSTNPAANDFAAVNLGQLKNLTQPIYDQLMAIGYNGPPLGSGTASTSGTYPWLASGHGATNDYAAANIGQLKSLFSFDPTYSSADDGIPDWWVLKYFPGASLSGTAAIDPDAYTSGTSGTITFLQAFNQGLNPLGYYNGQTPTLQIVSGTDQSAYVSTFLSSPIVVQLKDPGGAPIPHAPVLFTVEANGGLALSVQNASVASSLGVMTDSGGYASVLFETGTSVGSATIQAAAGPATPVTITESVTTPPTPVITLIAPADAVLLP